MKKTVRILFYLLIFQSFVSCESKYSESELKANFSTEQQSDLNEIRQFFLNQVCESDFKLCYEQTNHDSLQASGIGFWTKIDFKEQQKLYERISKSTFNEIWMICKSVNYKTKEEKKSICANAIGKYQNYLSDLGKNNPRIAKYAERIEASGDFGGLDISYWNVLTDKKHFDLNDPNIQLILAIHYLSMNDQQKRDENWNEK